jgi:hypothetical protein
MKNDKSMRSRDLVLTCLSLITCSIAVLPVSVYLGIQTGYAMILSSAVMLAGMAFAVWAIEADKRNQKQKFNAISDRKN